MLNVNETITFIKPCYKMRCLLRKFGDMLKVRIFAMCFS